MTAAALAFAAANLLVIAALPRLFFRPGRLNGAWWFTAAPFILAGLGICAVAAGFLAPVVLPAGQVVLAAGAMIASCASVALIAWAADAHRHPVSLWHQEHDTPASLVMSGPYALVRHPFYTAFLIALSACLLAAPSVLTLFAVALGGLQLTRTARREESRLSAEFGDYAEYMKRTGRFVPRRRTSSPSPFTESRGARRG